MSERKNGTAWLRTAQVALAIFLPLAGWYGAHLTSARVDAAHDQQVDDRLVALEKELEAVNAYHAAKMPLEDTIHAVAIQSATNATKIDDLTTQVSRMVAAIDTLHGDVKTILMRLPHHPDLP